MSKEQINFMRKKNPNAGASYSQLFKNTLMFREKTEKLKPSPVQQSPASSKERSTATPLKEKSTPLLLSPIPLQSFSSATPKKNVTSPLQLSPVPLKHSPVPLKQSIVAAITPQEDKHENKEDDRQDDKQDDKPSPLQPGQVSQQDLSTTTPQKEVPSIMKSPLCSLENQINPENAYSEMIVMSNQEGYIWESSVFDLRVKQEEFDEENVNITIGDLQENKIENDRMLIEKSETEKILEDLLANKKAHDDADECRPTPQFQMIPESNTNDVMHIENENLEQSRIENKEATEAPELPIRRSVSFQSDTLRDEDFSIEENKQEPAKESPKKVKVMRKPILKRTSNEDKDSGGSSSLCGSKKKVTFQGLKNDDEDETDNSGTNENGKITKPEPTKPQPKTQIGLISKVLQWRLKEEEEKRGIQRAPLLPNPFPEAMGKVFSKPSSQEQKKPVFKLPGLKRSYKFKGPASNSTGMKPEEANLKLLEDEPEEENKSNFKPTKFQALKEAKKKRKISIPEDEVEEEDTGFNFPVIEPREEENNAPRNMEPGGEGNQDGEFSMSKLWESLKEQNKKKSVPGPLKKASRLDFFETVSRKDPESTPEESKTTQNEVIRKEETKPEVNVGNTSPIKGKNTFNIVSNRLKLSKFNTPQPQETKEKEDLQINDIKQNSPIARGYLTGHVPKASPDNPSKKKVLIDKILRAKEAQSQPNPKSPIEEKEPELPQHFQSPPQYTQHPPRHIQDHPPKSYREPPMREENSNSLGQEIEEFLKKIRQKRQQEKIKGPETVSGPDSGDYQNEGFRQPEIDHQEENSRRSLNNFSSRRIADTFVDEEESFESRGSKMQYRNPDNYIEKNRRNYEYGREYEARMPKPQSRVTFQSTPDDEEDEYEEIIVVRRRKIKPKHKRRSQISIPTSSIEDILAQLTGRRGKRAIEDSQLTLEDSPPSLVRESPPVRQPSYRTDSVPVHVNPRRAQNDTYIQDIQEENDTSSNYEEPIRTNKEPINIMKEQPPKVSKQENQPPKRQTSAELAQQILERRPKLMARPENIPEDNLSKNTAGNELKTLPQKIAKKKNIIEEDDPYDKGIPRESNFHSNGFRDDENSRSSFEQPQYDRRKNSERTYTAEDSFYGVKLPPGSWRQNKKVKKNNLII